MTTHRNTILGVNNNLSVAGDCFFEPYSIKATNDLFKHLVLIFNDTGTDVGISGVFDVPQIYVGTPLIDIIWTATAITGNVRWQFNYRAVGGDDAESLDQATYQETVELNDVAPSAIHERLVASLSLTAANLLAGDTAEFLLNREGSDTGNDTMAAAAIVHGAYFKFNDA